MEVCTGDQKSYFTVWNEREMIKHQTTWYPWKTTGENSAWLTAETQIQKVPQKLKLRVLANLCRH